MRVRILYSFFSALIVVQGMAQEFSIKRVEQSRDAILVYYDLVTTDRNQPYRIQLYSSIDNFQKPLQKVGGDVGIEIRPGINKKILWNALDELGPDFRGDIRLEIRGKIYTPFIHVNILGINNVMKRGIESEIGWKGETDEATLNFSLYRNDNLLKVYDQIPNSGSTKIILPKNIKTGRGYYFIVNDPSNKDRIVKTDLFSIQHRFPLWARLSPAVVVAGVIVFLIPEKEPSGIESPLGPPSRKN